MKNINLYELNDVKTRTISCENKDGSVAGGCKAEPLKDSPGEHLGKGWKSSPFVTVKAGETFEMAKIQGMGEIVSMWLTGEVDRGTILRMYWDDSQIPSVECPITDFFLYGFAKPHVMANWNSEPNYRVNSALITVNPNRGLNCYIPMPFRKNAKITLENRTTEDKIFYYQVNYELKEIPENAGYFHAQYRMSLPVKFGEVHTVLDGVYCKGRYLGTALYVGLNRGGRWWGEGEFKFYMDGDKEYPTICTTGLEDYFCGAFNWDCEGEYQTYCTPYAGMPHIYKPDGLYNIQQRFNLYRFHVVDPIRFDNDLKITVQDLGWGVDDTGTWKNFLQREDDFISVAYFYLDKPITKIPELIDHKTLVNKF